MDFGHVNRFYLITYLLTYLFTYLLCINSLSCRPTRTDWRHAGHCGSCVKLYSMLCDGEKKLLLLLLSFGLRLTGLFFHKSLQVGPGPPQFFRTVLRDCCCKIFYEPDTLPVTHPALKHCNRSQSENVDGQHSNYVQRHFERKCVIVQDCQSVREK